MAFLELSVPDEKQYCKIYGEITRLTSFDPVVKKEQAAADNIRTLYQTLAQLLITKMRIKPYGTAAFVDAKHGNFGDGVSKAVHRATVASK